MGRRIWLARMLPHTERPAAPQTEAVEHQSESRLFHKLSHCKTSPTKVQTGATKRRPPNPESQRFTERTSSLCKSTEGVGRHNISRNNSSDDSGTRPPAHTSESTLTITSMAWIGVTGGRLRNTCGCARPRQKDHTSVDIERTEPLCSWQETSCDGEAGNCERGSRRTRSLLSPPLLRGSACPDSHRQAPPSVPNRGLRESLGTLHRCRPCRALHDCHHEPARWSIRTPAARSLESSCWADEAGMQA